MKILILEDEIPAFQKLLSFVKDYFNDEVGYDWARSNAEGKLFLESNTYDIILSDIQLLDGVSFDLYNEVNIDAPIIFCSAHDEYLFQAFSTNGIAYILKPYTQLDFKKALEKYQALFNKGDYNSLSPKTITNLKIALQEEHNNYKTRFVIKKVNGIQLLSVSEISTIEASGDFCIATDAKGKRHTISLNLGTVHQQLHPNKFFKINRSEIISIDFIDNIESHFKNRLLLKMVGAKEKVMTSSSTTAEFRKWLEQ